MHEHVYLLFCAHLKNIFRWTWTFFHPKWLRCLVCVICNSSSFHSFIFKLCIMMPGTLTILPLYISSYIISRWHLINKCPLTTTCASLSFRQTSFAPQQAAPSHHKCFTSSKRFYGWVCRPKTLTSHAYIAWSSKWSFSWKSILVLGFFKNQSNPSFTITTHLHMVNKHSFEGIWRGRSSLKLFLSKSLYLLFLHL